MIFCSLEFICVFLPVVIILYNILPSLKIKNALLIIASLLFYAYGEPVYVLLMIGSVAANYIFARLIDKCIHKKAFLVSAVVFNLVMLGIFKYTSFIVNSINSVFSLKLTVPYIALPVGISFFTFQALSYVIDVYRGDVKVQKNFFNILLYISFFPQLIAGPIVKYHDIEKALSERKQSFDGIASGMRRFIAGLAKKVLIANAAGQVADAIFGTDILNINFISAWLAAIAYMLQIYYDFSGYSDMAIGLGRMFGFKFAENFSHPYASASIKEFWRRWHISLSTWFKEYLYIPLGGNRKGRFRTCINKLIVFFTTGLWHGANWTFVLWGLYHGVFLLIEDFVPKPKKNPPKLLSKLLAFLSHIYALVVVCVGFVIFRADNISEAFGMIGRMFGAGVFTDANISFVLQQLTPYFITMCVAGILFAVPVPLLIQKVNDRLKASGKTKAVSVFSAVLYAVSMPILIWCMLRLSGSTYNPFIYFRF